MDFDFTVAGVCWRSTDHVADGASGGRAKLTRMEYPSLRCPPGASRPCPMRSIRPPARPQLRPQFILVAVILLLTSLCSLRRQTRSAWILNSSFHVRTATSISHSLGYRRRIEVVTSEASKQLSWHCTESRLAVYEQKSHTQLVGHNPH